MRLDLDRQPPESGQQPACGFTAEDYAQVLADLLPRGWAWPRDPAAILMKVFAGLAVEFWRVHERDCDLLREAYPGTAVETLPDWERVCGLPDPCVEPPIADLTLRQLAVLAKLAARGGQSRAYYILVAAAFGFHISITEFRPFRAGQGRAGDPVAGYDWIFTWRVTAFPAFMLAFRAGVNTAGDPLRAWGNRLLECILEAIKPAHTLLQFRYLDRLLGQSQWDSGRTVWDSGRSNWDVRD